MANYEWAGVCNVEKLDGDRIFGKCGSCGHEFHNNRLQDALNHYLGHGDWILLHLGTETTPDGDKLHHRTVAFVGQIRPDYAQDEC